jgi:hypothetical protein
LNGSGSTSVSAVSGTDGRSRSGSPRTLRVGLVGFVGPLVVEDHVRTDGLDAQ